MAGLPVNRIYRDLKRLLIILLAVCALHAPALATHIVGGVINYHCLGNNQYQVTLKVYRDCFNGLAGFDDPAHVGIYDGNGILFTTVTLFSPQITNIPPVINNPCFTAPNSVCVEEGVYTTVVTLPANLTGYHLVYQRCCRNNSIINLVNPGGVGATYTAFVPPQAQVSCNSNPVFDLFPPIFLCVNVPFTFDHSATDADGDSLVYELCDPFEGASSFSPMPTTPSGPPFTAVPWNSGYNTSYQITSAPAIQVGYHTGQLTVTPGQLGQFVVGVCVKEYRNGVLLSSTLRDFQFNVVNCPGIVVASFPGQQIFCDGFQVQFTNNSINSNNYHWDFGVPGVTTDTSNQNAPTFNYPASGTYTVTLVANPYTPCADTAQSTFFIKPPLNAGFIPPPPQCATGNNFSFSATGNYSANANFQWTFGSGTPGSATGQSPSGISFPGAGTYPVTISINDSACSDTHTSTVTVLASPIAMIDPQDEYCIGTTLDFTQSSQNGNTYFWDFGDPALSNDTSNNASPSYTYQDTGTYTVMLVVDNGICPDTTYHPFIVMPSLESAIQISDTAMCFENHLINLQAAGIYDSTAAFHWTFSNGSNVLFSHNSYVPGLQFNDVGVHTIHLAISAYGCQAVATEQVTLYPPLKIGFEVPSSACVPMTFSLVNQSEAWTPIFCQWDFGDGTTSTDFDPSHTYSFPGTYQISLLAYTAQGCIDSAFLQHPSVIQVHPNPVSLFSVDPKESSIFDPQVIFTDLSTGSSSGVFDMGDGSTFYTSHGTHYYQDTGSYTITHTATNEWGCTDTSAQGIYIYPGHIPNAFTPNGKGSNEFFAPVFANAKSISMEIYDRWGELIFKSTDINYGWDGTYRGLPAQQDMYVYKIEAGSKNGKTYSFTGNVFLLR